MVKTYTETTEDDSFDDNQEVALSKTRIKRNMHELQALGESLVGLSKKRLDELQLADKLYEAVIEAQKIKSRGAKARQFQYIGRLMRDIDPEPIRQKMALWAQGLTGHEAVHQAAEHWRERLMTEPETITAFLEKFENIDSQVLDKLIQKAKMERARQLSPVAYRKLFRLIRDCLINEAAAQ